MNHTPIFDISDYHPAVSLYRVTSGSYPSGASNSLIEALWFAGPRPSHLVSKNG